LQAATVFCSFLTLASFAAAADYRVQANIRYSLHGETILDILQARAPALKNRPGVIFIHGDDWSQGQKEDVVKQYCVPFIEHGFVVANIDYRLAGSAHAPGAVNDALAAATWFQDRAPDYKVDPKQILVAGVSAGGELALMTAMVPESAGFGSTIHIAAVINFYGISDVADLLDKRSFAATWIPEQPGRMDLAKQLSPLNYVRKGLPPILTIHGDADPVVPYEQSVKLTKELKGAGVDTELITVSGAKHGLSDDQMATLWPQIFKWLKKRKIAP